TCATLASSVGSTWKLGTTRALKRVMNVVYHARSVASVGMPGSGGAAWQGESSVATSTTAVARRATLAAGSLEARGVRRSAVSPSLAKTEAVAMCFFPLGFRLHVQPENRREQQTCRC